MPAFLDPREIAIDLLDTLLHLAAIALDMRSRYEILLGAEMLEHAPSLEDLRHAHRGDIERAHSVDASRAERDRAPGHLAALAAKQAGDGFERRRLARAVGAQQRGNRRFRHRERDAFEDEDDAVVDDLDVVDRQ